MSIHDDYLATQAAIYNIGARRPAARSLPAYERQTEQVTITRSADGNLIAMTFLNADEKYVSTIKDIDPAQFSQTPGGVYVSTTFINRTGVACVISERSGIHLPSKPIDHVSARGMVIRHLYSFMTREDLLAFATRTNAVPVAHRSAVADTMLRQAQKVLDDSLNMHSLKIVVDYRIDWAVLQAKKRIYDPNTDLVISIADAFDAGEPHPAHDQATLSSAFDLFCQEQTTHFSQHLVKVCTASSMPRKLYYKYLGHVHVVQANLATMPMSEYLDGQPTGNMLSDFVEVFSSSAAAIIRCNGQYVTQTYSDDRKPVLIARVSLSDAMQQYGLFDSAHLADTHGNPDAIAEQQYKTALREHERTILNLKKELQEANNLHSEQEHERRVKEAVNAERAQTLKLSEELRILTLKNAQQDAEYSAKITELEQKRVIQEQAHQQTVKESSNKGWIELLKLIGAAIVLAGAVVTAVIKFWPAALMSGVSKLVHALPRLAW